MTTRDKNKWGRIFTLIWKLARREIEKENSTSFKFHMEESTSNVSDSGLVHLWTRQKEKKRNKMEGSRDTVFLTILLMTIYYV